MNDRVSEQSTCGKGERRIYPSAPISHWSKSAPQLLALLGCTSWSSYSHSGSPDPRELLCSEPQQPARGPFGQPSRALQDQAHWCTCTNTRRLLRHSPSRGTKPNPALARGGKRWEVGRWEVGRKMLSVMSIMTSDSRSSCCRGPSWPSTWTGTTKTDAPSTCKDPNLSSWPTRRYLVRGKVPDGHEQQETVTKLGCRDPAQALCLSGERFYFHLGSSSQ